jgi:hypothetical protein
MKMQNNKSMSLTGDRDGHPIQASNSFVCTDWVLNSPLSTSWSETFAIPANCAEIILAPVGGDLRVLDALGNYDLVKDWTKEVFWVAWLTSVTVQATAPITLYFRFILL